MSTSVVAVVLAAGRGARMGTPKALLEVDGTPLVAHTVALLREIFSDIVVVTSSPEIVLAAGVPATADRLTGKGPLAEKVTELGVTSWRPVVWRRSKSVSPRGEGPTFQGKVRGRMTSALIQSGSGWLPDSRVVGRWGTA